MGILRSPLRRYWVVSLAAFVCNAATAAGIVTESFLAGALLWYAHPVFLVWWAKADARESRYWPFYHYGLWLYCFSFAALPQYLLRTRGRAGVLPAMGLVTLLYAPYAAWWLGWWLQPFVPEALWAPAE